ncbi:F-actin-uncapping protein LRRC16A-like isoform X2 [Petromyzon marinus]|uniref:F-actin-uncapping protein LRRC16A-like isoform X2 n=1 Tax=Petromyzon marinus TaxID=7757 RepID=A0AAJ7UEG8_PETMA|nr:F-actin-uncapping protein LRRC16A-like isoform X2 [Petromyzon marinus]
MAEEESATSGSWRSLLGRHGAPRFHTTVRLDTKGSAAERLLVLTAWRGFLLSTRTPSKVESTFHFLEIQAATLKGNKLLLETERVGVTMTMGSAEEADVVLVHIMVAAQAAVPGVSPPFLKRLTLDMHERANSLQTAWARQSIVDMGPCGGFSQTYACICDQLGLPCREEVQWDVDTIYLSHDSRELSLNDFSHLDGRDLVPIVATLEFSSWFTKLHCKDVRLSAEVCEQVLRVMSRSSRLEELVLENVGLKSDFLQKLAAALTQNPASCLHSINLSNNSLEDRGLYQLSQQLSRLGKGLRSLNLSRTALTLKGVNAMSQALMTSELTLNSLTCLDLSSVVLRADETSNLYAFLAQPNALAVLDLSGTESVVETMFGALLRGCCRHLQELRLSKNVFSYRKARDVLPSCRRFFSSALILSHIDLSDTRLPAPAVRELLLGLAANKHLQDVSLELSGCELRLEGSKALKYCLEDVPNLSRLDLADNGLDSDLLSLMNVLGKNRSIRHLDLGRNFSSLKPKMLSKVLDGVVQLIQDEDSMLQSLSLADSRLKSGTSVVVNALGSNASLASVDLSGNAMGDLGARMLAKALAINSSLRTVIWDKNGTTAQGFQDVASALEKNYSLRFMPLPMHDAAAAMKTQPERTEEALQKIEKLLLRNHGSRRSCPEQAYRLQHGILASTSQQLVDRMCVRAQDQLRALQSGGVGVTEGPARSDMMHAQALLQEAKNSKALLPTLFHHSPGGPDPLSVQMEETTAEVAAVLDSQLQAMLEAMVRVGEGLCPHTTAAPGVHAALLAAGAERISVPRSLVRSLGLEQAAVELHDKASEVRLSLSALLADRITDKLLEQLCGVHAKLAGHLAGHGLALRGQPPPAGQASPQEDGARSEEADIVTMSPVSRKRSLRNRRMRPVSRAFADGVLDGGAAAATAAPQKGGTSEPPPMDVSEPPPGDAGRLEHVTKGRPKKPGRPGRQHRPSVSASLRGVQDEGAVDEGIAEFFTKKVLPPSARLQAVGTERGQHPHGRKGSFFSFLKPWAPRPPQLTSQPTLELGPASTAPDSSESSLPPPAVKKDAAELAREGPTEAVTATEEAASPVERWRMFGVPVMMPPLPAGLPSQHPDLTSGRTKKSDSVSQDDDSTESKSYVPGPGGSGGERRMTARRRALQPPTSRDLREDDGDAAPEGPATAVRRCRPNAPNGDEGDGEENAPSEPQAASSPRIPKKHEADPAPKGAVLPRAALQPPGSANRCRPASMVEEGSPSSVEDHVFSDPAHQSQASAARPVTAEAEPRRSRRMMVKCHSLGQQVDE